MGERVGTSGDHFTGIAIDAIARHRGEAFDQRFTGQPVGKEGANHRITNYEFTHARAHRDYLTSTIGHGYARFARPPHTANDREIVIVE